MSLIRFVFRLLLGRRLPITQGSLRVTGPTGRVTIRRDRWGVPLIDAESPTDGAFAVGFCQAQDRAFQLELLLRVGRGTLSEMVGPGALPVDRLSRRIGFYRSANEQLPVLDADVRALLEAYALGVRAGVGVGLSRPPHELSILRAQPTPWTAQDTLAITKLLSFTLTANWDAELVRLKVLTMDGPEALRALDVAYPAWHPASAPVGQAAGAAVDRLAADLDALFSVLPPGGGSNNWAVSGARSSSGRPLLANDPHLDSSLPPHWYLVRVREGKNTVAGAAFAGGPTVLVGHNGTACWGLTAGMIDNTDLFLEEVGPDGASVRGPGGFVGCQVVEEVIGVKGGPAVSERVLITPRGPIISPALVEVPQALSLRATWLDPVPVRGFFRVHSVRSFAELRAAFADWPLSPQNVLYADTSGAIGWQLIGRAPLRKKGLGALPLPGWDEGVGWRPEMVPYEEMPHLESPPNGFLATANARPLPEGQGPFLGLDFIDGYRQRSIVEALAARTDWDVASVMRLQMDQRALAWQEMREIVLVAPPSDAQAGQALELLRGWDGVVGATSPAATVYELFLAEMIKRIAQAKAPKSWRWPVGAGLSPLASYNFGCYRRTGHLVRLLREQPPGWFPRPWPEVISQTLGDAVRFLTARFGKDVRRWAWGAIRPLVLRHPLAKAPGMLGKALAAVFNLGPVPCGGDADVINQAAALPLDPLAVSDNIPSLRAVFDVGAWHNSRFVLPGGQSGNPLSPHYGDQFALWQKGEGVPIAFTAEEVQAATVATLELVPGAVSGKRDDRIHGERALR